MRQSTYEKAKDLEEADIHFFHNIYQFRCLSVDQSYNYFFRDYFSSIEDFKEIKLEQFIALELIELIEYKEGHAIFLTNQAIEIIRDYYGFSTNIVDTNNNRQIIKRGYFTAGELRMLPRLVNHQVHLNRFVLDFNELAKDEHLNWKHYGEKSVSQYFGIRPDALLRFYDVDIFLEQDMATESKTQLMSKWDHYRTYLRSRESEQNNRKIIVLFIVDNTKNIERRKELVRFTATDSLIDLFSSKFEIYTGTRDDLLDLLFTEIIPTLQNLNGTHNHFNKIMRLRHKFIVNDAARLNKFLSDTEYSFLAYKTDKNDNLLIENGRLQEFLFDNAMNNPLSIHHKIAYHKRNSAAFYRNMNRNISVIFIVESEEVIKNQLQLTNLMGTDNVYYTTIKRLERLTFSESLFQFDRAGKRYHFQDSGLTKRIFEDTEI